MPQDHARSARRLTRWTIILVGLSILWRLTRFVLDFPIWGDEAFVAVSLQTRDFIGLLQPLEHYQIVPVGFMWMCRASIGVFGDSAAAMRIPSLLVGIASVLLVWRLANRLLDCRSAFLAVAIFAASYYPMRHAVELKPYSMDLFGAVLLMNLAWTVWCRPRWWGGWAMLGGAGTLLVWFAYPSVFVSGALLAALTVIVIRERSGRVVLMWLASGAFLVASFVAMYLVVAKGQEEAGRGLYRAGSIWHGAFPPIREPWKLPLWFIETHTGNMMAYPAGGKDYGSTGTFILVLVGIVSLCRHRRASALLLLAPFGLTLFAAMIEKYPYGESARVMQHLAPMICLLAGAGLMAIGQSFKRPGFVLRATPWAMTAIIAVGLVSDVLQPYKADDDRLMRETMDGLHAQVEAGDHIVIAGTFEPDGIAPDLNLFGGRCARMRHFIHRWQFPSLHWAPTTDDLPTSGTIWLVVYRQAIPERDDLQSRIESYANDVIDVISDFGSPDRAIIDIEAEPFEVSVEILRFDLDDRPE